MINTKESVMSVIQTLAAQLSIPVNPIKDHYHLVDDLGFSSLDIASLVSYLEMELGVDPFLSGQINITDIRTVSDMVHAYEKCLSLDMFIESEKEPEPAFVKNAIRRAEARRAAISQCA
jgi:acyl carrier protein